MKIPVTINDGKKTFNAFYEPDYKHKCIICGSTPVVVIKRLQDNSVFYSESMCGPCTWGEAATIDPKEW